MSIETLSIALAEQGVEHRIVIAKARKKFSDIEAFKKSLSDADVRDYADSYYKWVKGGRSGSAPKADSANYPALKYVRVVVSQL